jgi:hypothetical protein
MARRAMARILSAVSFVSTPCSRSCSPASRPTARVIRKIRCKGAPSISRYRRRVSGIYRCSGSFRSMRPTAPGFSNIGVLRVWDAVSGRASPSGSKPARSVTRRMTSTAVEEPTLAGGAGCTAGPAPAVLAPSAWRSPSEGVHLDRAFCVSENLLDCSSENLSERGEDDATPTPKQTVWLCPAP